MSLFEPVEKHTVLSTLLFQEFSNPDVFENIKYQTIRQLKVLLRKNDVVVKGPTAHVRKEVLVF